MRFAATYHVRCPAADINARAQAIAVEQSVEMPLAAIDDPAVLQEIVGQVEDIAGLGNGIFAVRIALAAATVGDDAGQLLNMLFGNTSLLEDVTLADVDLPQPLLDRIGRPAAPRPGAKGVEMGAPGDAPGDASGGPQAGAAALRRRIGVPRRALTASALKPQGLVPHRLALLAEHLALGGLDFVKDDHGLADQEYSPFAERLAACAGGIARAASRTGHPTQYIPSLTGDLDQLRAQAALTQQAGVACAMVAPMVSGFAAVQALAREFPALTLFAHPSMGGLRIAPDLLIGKLFPLIGAGAVIFPSHGGRFGYSRATCAALAANARARDALPVPAGGMTLDRTGEILDFYGPDTILLIGGNMLLARGNIPREAEAFARAVAAHSYH